MASVLAPLGLNGRDDVATPDPDRGIVPRLLQDRPIRQQLTTILLLTSGIVLLLTTAAFVSYEFFTFRRTALKSLATLGQILAENSTAALAFANEADARELLSGLRAEPHIVAAALYDMQGRLFARHPATLPDSAIPASPGLDGYRLEQSHLVGFQPVAQERNARLGTLYLRSDTDAVYDALRVFGAVAVSVMALSLLVAYLLSTLLQDKISRPILALADTAAAVSDHQDYSVRAPALGRNELGQLTDAFNQMLGRIEAQDRALRDSKERLDLALGSSGVGTWSWDVAANRVIWDDFSHPLFGLGPDAMPTQLGGFLDLVHSDDRDRVAGEVAAAVANQAPYDTEFQVVLPDRSRRALASRGRMYHDEAGQPVRMAGASWDITDRRRAEERQRQLITELGRSNHELEQFAYVASHDLQEPLRMVSSYTQLLERRYRDQLDEDARVFIGYAVDGATRMQRLINDLLEFSRIGTRGKPARPVDINQVLGIVRVNLSMALEDTGALVTNDELPTVPADETQLVQLLQNLVGNAIKFHRDERPHVHVSAQQTGSEWVVSVRDNGIGIAGEYLKRIFLIFQRLHSKEQYPGTGIGLAVCRRIVERHGGGIWVESTPGTGSTFFFSLPQQPGEQGP